MLQTLARRGGSALLRRRCLPTAALTASLPCSASEPAALGAMASATATAGAGAGGAAPLSTAAAAAKEHRQPPAAGGSGSRGGGGGGGGGGSGGEYKPKKRGKGKKPSATAQYLAERAAALAQHEAAAAAAKLPWRTVAACIIERHPIIMRDPEPWEAEYYAMQEELMQHGKAFPKDLNLMGNEAEYGRTDEDVLRELPFKLAPRVTKADRLNDRTTLNRALAERLFLLVKGPATQGAWALPQGEFDHHAKQQGVGAGAGAGTGSMRAHHEALIQRFMGDKFEAYVPSNAPVGFHWRALPAAEQKAQGAYGDKVFFYRSQHLKGRGRVVAEGVDEFVWVTKAEVGEYLGGAGAEDPEYVKLLTAIL